MPNGQKVLDQMQSLTAPEQAMGDPRAAMVLGLLSNIGDAGSPGTSNNNFIGDMLQLRGQQTEARQRGAALSSDLLLNQLRGGEILARTKGATARTKLTGEQTRRATAEANISEIQRRSQQNVADAIADAEILDKLSAGAAAGDPTAAEALMNYSMGHSVRLAGKRIKFKEALAEEPLWQAMTVGGQKLEGLDARVGEMLVNIMNAPTTDLTKEIRKGILTNARDAGMGLGPDKKTDQILDYKAQQDFMQQGIKAIAGNLKYLRGPEIDLMVDDLIQMAPDVVGIHGDIAKTTENVGTAKGTWGMGQADYMPISEIFFQIAEISGMTNEELVEFVTPKITKDKPLAAGVLLRQGKRPKEIEQRLQRKQRKPFTPKSEEFFTPGLNELTPIQMPSRGG